ncbi:hypothetical protein CG51_01550 [Haematobacter missouriensis]|uniref:DUF4239 domain-containing protein n=1 Tax=Haematobacter missouriensis TaxID=366616 RepID=A0A212AHR9_9RHOB|nr:DUF4239 domain-containing protein [Haematobacter missouriensis]KFI32502.1 hypothetical protein CG51_01550 [Haematobacter missouriensis]OWJ76518.1 hypothetical protein CDV53_08335 [Haematobacter missouriensis]OWJ80963.1 hypothetical protein CDV52_20265 [Haematobacter missouriensis]
MFDFVYDIPQQQLAIGFLAMAIIGMLLGMLVFKPVMRVLIGSGPDLNESINYATSGFSLFYGLLLGLLTVSAYQNNDRVRTAMLDEANSISALYADVNVYPEPLRSDMKDMLRDYVLFTIHKDWAAHQHGDFLDGGNNRSNAMRQRLAEFEPQTPGQEIVHAEVLSAFRDFVTARQQRIAAVFVRIPQAMWYAVFGGAVISVLLICLLRMRPLRQFFLGAVTSLFLAVILFVMSTLDAPLRGAAGLRPESLIMVWERSMSWDEPRY